MESTDLEHYQVALILPLKGDYETAINLLDECFTRRSLHSSGAEYSLGKAGSHHLVLVTGLSNISAAESVARVVPELVEEFSFIRACFLVGVSAIAPRDGLAQAGDIVVGMPQDYESGLVQFDADKARREKRLHAMGHWRKPPPFVGQAIDDTLSTQGRDEWHAYLAKHSSTMAHSNEPTDFDPSMNTGSSKETASTPDSPSLFNLIREAPRVLKGRVGSSNTTPGDPELLQVLARDSGILCFETAAANLQTRLPLAIVCGIIQGNPSVPRRETASKAASVYAMFLACRLMSSELIRSVRLGHFFHYQPLSVGKSPFRLLRLHHGTGYPIQCSIVEGDLDDLENLMEYSALSYAWGNSYAGEMINLDGRVLYITARLHGALQHLRDRNEDKTLWTDAICIDQINIMERSHQVAHMGRIYKHANNVIIWLGLASQNANLLITTLARLHQKVLSQPFRKWQFRDDRWKDAWEELHGEDISGGPLHLQLVNGLDELTRMSWFTRVWIIQEVANAKRARIQCSAGAIDASFLALAPWLLEHSIDEQPQAVLDIFPGPSRECSWWNENRTLGTLLGKFQKCQATDPRDRVYALLGIASDMENQAIQPDYSKSEQQVLRDTCNYLFDGEQLPELSNLQRIEPLQSGLGQWAEASLEKKMRWGVKSKDLERFLNRHGHVKWNEKIRELASFDLGHSTLALLLTKCETPLPITPKLFREAFQIGSDAMDLLFDKGAVEDESLKSLVLFAARFGDDIALDTLFERYEIPSRLGNDMIEYMTPQPIKAAERLYLGSWKHEFEISESTTRRLIQIAPVILKIFLRSKTSKLQITEAILRQALAIPYYYGLLLDRRNQEVNVSEREAIRAINGGPETLRVCLDRPGTNFQVTEAILEAAMLRGRDVVEILLRRRESEVNVRREIQEIYQLRDDLRRHVLGTLGRTKHATMLREASSRYENLNNPEPIGPATAAPGETTDVVQWLGSEGLSISRWRTVHEIFRELILEIGSDVDTKELRFQGDSDGDADVEEWMRLERFYGANGPHRRVTDSFANVDLRIDEYPLTDWCT
ncbi:hypothetical protein BHE90_012537 [Fusarium euwallaceae]|uniref:Heterokaryon incompatibility domain-containing protein n=2 Tax=Fusarium solani species complex TaxID=232080 RepID=A0A428T2J2_9HYPO|nr:hypothetical protein CEP52_011566 [Fusarium oligoseptatum]RTE73034.1 hypothetical protein BHE90_012537 [Fusarium euwallaceae]